MRLSNPWITKADYKAEEFEQIEDLKFVVFLGQEAADHELAIERHEVNAATRK